MMPDNLMLLRFTVERMVRAQRPELLERELRALADEALSLIVIPQGLGMWLGPAGLVVLEETNGSLPDADPAADWRKDYRSWLKGHPLFSYDGAITGALEQLRRMESEQER